MFSRDARTAYFISPDELLQIQKEAREKAEELRIIYHSHIDTGAYFSDEDARVAAPDGEPAYPGVRYLVVSIMKGKFHEARLFSWDPAKGKYIS